MGDEMDLISPMRVTDMVLLPCLIPVLLFQTSIHFVRSLFPSHPLHPLHWRQKLASSFLVATRTTLNPRMSYAINTRKSTGQQVREYCTTNNIEYKETSIPSAMGSTFPPPTLHFVSAEASRGPTILYVHGGGYLFPMVAPCHMPLPLHMAKVSQAKQVVYLEYTLAPTLRYPGQLSQIVQAVSYLLQRGVTPSELILAGDSAGGHLIAGLMAHTAQPCPQVPLLDLQGQQIRAAVLLSPWLDMKLANTSATTGTMDVLSRNQLYSFGKIFGTNPKHPWSEPLHAQDGMAIFSKSFSGSEGRKPVVGKILVTIGTEEVLFESCERFVAKFKQFKTVVMDSKGKEMIASIAENEACILAVGVAEVHVQPGIDIATGYYDGGSMIALIAFLNTL